MPIRDLVLLGVLVALVPAILAKPWLGPIAWAWISMMVPHRLTWGFAHDLPFAMIIAITTLIALLYARQRKTPPLTTVTVLLALWYLWMCVTSVFALNDSGDVSAMWNKVTKIQLMLWVTLVLLAGRKQIEVLVWTIVLSIGYYGVKGGAWVLITGGGERVWGPAGSFIEGNNELAVATLITIPLMWYLRSIAVKPWARFLWLVAIGLCCMSVLGSHSRGAALALAAMMLFFGIKSGRPLVTSVAAIAILGAMVAFMPEHWERRIESISAAEDHSAQSRLYTWRMIWNLVSHRPWGAGYDFWTPEVWSAYAVDAWRLPYSPHSIYFQALGEHGFVGIALYLGIGIATWRLASRMIRTSGNDPQTQWLRTLLRCVQVSLVTFAVGGAFLNLVNFDVPYYLAIIVVLLWRDCRPVPAAERSRSSGRDGARSASLASQPVRNGAARSS
jgi:probable O-glycosylation ligase (exosortase A-associated)